MLRNAGMIFNHVLPAVVALALAAPLEATRAGVDERPNDGDCGSANAFYMTDVVVPSITVTICADCGFTETDRYTLLHSYGEAARRVGYLIDPLNSTVFRITETGVLPDGKPFLKGVVGNRDVLVGDPSPGETLAGAAGQLALTVVAGDY